MANVQPAYQPSAGSYFNMMVNGDGYVVINSSAAVVTASSQLSPGITVTKTGTGEYTVVLPKAYSFLAPLVTFAAPTAVALYPQVGSVTTSSFIVRLVNGSGAATNPGAACAFYFDARCRDSSVKR